MSESGGRWQSPPPQGGTDPGWWRHPLGDLPGPPEEDDPVGGPKRWPKWVFIAVPILGVLAGVLIVLGVTGSGSNKKVVATPGTTRHAAAPTTATGVPTTTTTATTTRRGVTTTAAPATTTTTKAPPGVTFKVTGTGSSTALSVTVIEGAKELQHPGANLPYTMTLPNDHPTYGLTAQATARTTGSITCEIDQPGHPPVTKTSRGAYALVNCIGASG
ncbi:MAG: hypothetical protein M3137_06620 [Actinomycetota bacterium]|nr:hypothetical protein [Actinomycetota bacterium]